MKIDITRMNLVEKDIEDYLWGNPHVVSFYNSSLEKTYGVERWIGRQVEVASGIIDLFGVFSNGNPVIVEIKNVPIDGRAVAQIIRYEHDIWKILELRNNFYTPRGIVTILIGPSIDTKAMHECTAAGIIPMVFEAYLGLEVWKQSFSEDYLQQIDEKMERLALKDDLFACFDNLNSSNTEEVSQEAEEDLVQDEN